MFYRINSESAKAINAANDEEVLTIYIDKIKKNEFGEWGIDQPKADSFYAHKVYDTNMSCAKCYLYKNSIGCAKEQCLSKAPQPTMFHLEKVEYNE